MGKSCLTLVMVCIFGVCAAVAQDSGSATSQNAQQPGYSQAPNTQAAPADPSAGNSGRSSSTVPSSTQSAMSNGAVTVSSGGDQTVEGCLMKEQTNYFVQPESGGARVQLTPSRSLDSYVGQHVRVAGHTDASVGDNSATATATATGGPADMGGMLTVTSVKTISGSCNPGNTSSQR